MAQKRENSGKGERERECGDQNGKGTQTASRRTLWHSCNSATETSPRREAPASRASGKQEREREVAQLCTSLLSESLLWTIQQQQQQQWQKHSWLHPKPSVRQSATTVPLHSLSLSLMSSIRNWHCSLCLFFYDHDETTASSSSSPPTPPPPPAPSAPLMPCAHRCQGASLLVAALFSLRSGGGGPFLPEASTSSSFFFHCQLPFIVVVVGVAQCTVGQWTVCFTFTSPPYRLSFLSFWYGSMDVLADDASSGTVYCLHCGRPCRCFSGHCAGSGPT